MNVAKINGSTNNCVHLMHVPNQRQSDWTYQTSDTNDPTPWPSAPQWVKLSICLDFDPNHGIAKVWQNGTLVSTANVQGGCGILKQAHFGLYAPPSVSSGEIYNDNLVIQEITHCP